MNVPRLLPPALALAAALLAGFVLGRCTGPEIPAAALASSPHAPASSAVSSAAASTTENDPATASTLSFEEALAEPVTLRRTVRLAMAVSALDQAQTLAALEQIGNDTQTATADSTAAARRALISRLAELDPAGAAAYAMQPALKGHSDLLQFALEVWVQTDLDSALAWTGGLPPGKLRTDAQYTLALLIVEKNPDAAFALEASIRASGSSSYMTSAIFEKLAAVNPLEAAARAVQLPRANDRSGALSSVVSAWAEKDPDAALAWAGQLTDRSERAGALVAAITVWSRTDAPTAGAYLLAHVDPVDLQHQAGVIYQIAQTWAELDPAAALAWRDQLPNGVRSTYENSVFGVWSQKDPAAAARMAMASISPDRRDSVLSDVVQKWAEADLEAARVWVVALPSGSARANALSSLAYAWVERDPRAAVEFFLRQPTAGDGEPNEPLRAAATRWLGNDADAALAWSRTLPEGSQSDEVISALAEQVAQNDPARAIAQIERLSPEKRADTAGNIARSWAGSDGQTAAAWAQALPVGDVRDKAVEASVEAWGNDDPAAAVRWLAAQPRDKAVDEAMIKLADPLTRNDPVAATRWAEGLGDTGVRQRAAERVAQQWLSTNTAEASAWITASPALNAAQKETLLTEL